jgi:type 1 glutamine amidotransferase
MTEEPAAALAILQQQLKELDALAKQTLQDLNTVAGTERVMKWKARTVALITDAVGQQEGLKFAGIHPGPSFTNDMVEEFTELIDCYRAPLSALAKQMTQAPRPSSGG